MNRQPATNKGLERRLRDARLDRVTDPRREKQGMVKLLPILNAMVIGLVTGVRSLRATERRTEQVARKKEGWHGLTRRIADNTIGTLLPRLRREDLTSCLHRLVKAEHRRGNLKPTRIPMGTVAIDGKATATLRWHDLCGAVGVDECNARIDEVKKRMAAKYPNAQFCVPKEGKPYALVRLHTVTLVSSDAAVPVHVQPIPASTNEIGAMPRLIEQLQAAYARTRLFEMITTDAGNTSVAVMNQAADNGWWYFAQIKSNHGEIHKEAFAVLGMRDEDQAEVSYTDTENGEVVEYRAWTYDLTNHGWLDWKHARQIVRVQRVATSPTTGKRRVGNRYYVTNCSPKRMQPKMALSTSRAHWRCENETHWTLDAELRDDRGRLAWSRNPDGILTMAVLRMIALALLAVVRRMSRIGYTHETPSWSEVMEHFLLQLCAPILNTCAFDEV